MQAFGPSAHLSPILGVGLQADMRWPLTLDAPRHGSCSSVVTNATPEINMVAGQDKAHTVHNAQHTVQRVQQTPHNKHYSPHGVQHTSYGTQRTAHSVAITAHSVAQHSTYRTEHCTPHKAQDTLIFFGLSPEVSLGHQPGEDEKAPPVLEKEEKKASENNSTSKENWKWQENGFGSQNTFFIGLY